MVPNFLNLKNAALILSLFFLFSFSVVLADIDSIDQSLVNQAYNRVLNQDQNVIKSHLGLYLEKHSSKNPEFVKRFKENAGLCNGLTILWLYSKWLDNQPEKINAYNSNWFKSTIEAIVAWNGDEKPQDEVANNFETFAALIDFFQFPDVYYSDMPQNDLEDMISLSNLDTDGKTLKKVYAATEVFTKSQLCELLKNNVYDNELVYIKYNSHAVGLFKHQENYYYYDSNYSKGEIQTSSIEEVVEIIFALNRSTDGKYSSIDIEVYSFDEETPFRLNQIDYSNQTNAYINSKNLLSFEYIGSYSIITSLSGGWEYVTSPEHCAIVDCSDVVERSNDAVERKIICGFWCQGYKGGREYYSYTNDRPHFNGDTTLCRACRVGPFQAVELLLYGVNGFERIIIDANKE